MLREQRDARAVLVPDDVLDARHLRRVSEDGGGAGGVAQEGGLHTPGREDGSRAAGGRDPRRKKTASDVPRDTRSTRHTTASEKRNKNGLTNKR